MGGETALLQPSQGEWSYGYGYVPYAPAMAAGDAMQAPVQAVVVLAQPMPPQQMHAMPGYAMEQVGMEPHWETHYVVGEQLPQQEHHVVMQQDNSWHQGSWGDASYDSYGHTPAFSSAGGYIAPEAAPVVPAMSAEPRPAAPMPAAAASAAAPKGILAEALGPVEPAVGSKGGSSVLDRIGSAVPEGASLGLDPDAQDPFFGAKIFVHDSDGGLQQVAQFDSGSDGYVEVQVGKDHGSHTWDDPHQEQVAYGGGGDWWEDEASPRSGSESPGMSPPPGERRGAPGRGAWSSGPPDTVNAEIQQAIEISLREKRSSSKTSSAPLVSCLKEAPSASSSCSGSRRVSFADGPPSVRRIGAADAGPSGCAKLVARGLREVQGHATSPQSQPEASEASSRPARATPQGLPPAPKQLPPAPWGPPPKTLPPPPPPEEELPQDEEPQQDEVPSLKSSDALLMAAPVLKSSDEACSATPGEPEEECAPAGHAKASSPRQTEPEEECAAQSTGRRPAKGKKKAHGEEAAASEGTKAAAPAATAAAPAAKAEASAKGSLPLAAAAAQEQKAPLAQARALKEGIRRRPQKACEASRAGRPHAKRRGAEDDEFEGLATYGDGWLRSLLKVVLMAVPMTAVLLCVGGMLRGGVSPLRAKPVPSAGSSPHAWAGAAPFAQVADTGRAVGSVVQRLDVEGAQALAAAQSTVERLKAHASGKRVRSPATAGSYSDHEREEFARLMREVPRDMQQLFTNGAFGGDPEQYERFVREYVQQHTQSLTEQERYMLETMAVYEFLGMDAMGGPNVMMGGASFTPEQQMEAIAQLRAMAESPYGHPF